MTLTNKTYGDLYDFFKKKITEENFNQKNQFHFQQSTSKNNDTNKKVKSQKELDEASDREAAQIIKWVVVLIVIVLIVLIIAINS